KAGTDGTEKNEPEDAAECLDDAVGEFRFLRGLLGSGSLGDQHLAGEILSRDCHGPEGAQSHGSESHRSESMASPGGDGEKFAEAAGFSISRFCLLACTLPLFRLLYHDSHPDDEESGDHPD